MSTVTVTTMNSNFKLSGIGKVLCLTLGLAGFMQAGPVFNEIGDAGQLLGTAQSVGNGVTTINGSIYSPGDIDLFKLTFAYTGNVTFNGVVTSGALDPNIYLFNSSGNVLAGNDNGGGFPNARITQFITPGTYYLSLGEYDLDARDSNNALLYDLNVGVINASGVLGGWSGSGTGNRADTGTYQLSTSIATQAPEPSTWISLAAGLGVLTFFRRRKLAAGRL